MLLLLTAPSDLTKLREPLSVVTHLPEHLECLVWQADVFITSEGQAWTGIKCAACTDPSLRKGCDLTYCQQHGEVTSHAVGKGLGIVTKLRVMCCGSH